uniref:Uncharacterized protein n=1 Tax=Solanum tuberosum TaxID=4113 RepID=M1DH84_SOLTU
MVEKCQESTLGSSPSSQSRNLQNKMILGFFSDLIRDWPATTVLTPLQQSFPGGNTPATAAFTEPVSRFKSFKPPFHNTPPTHDTQKLPVHAKISFGSSTHRIQFRKVARVP